MSLVYVRFGMAVREGDQLGDSRSGQRPKWAIAKRSRSPTGLWDLCEMPQRPQSACVLRTFRHKSRDLCRDVTR